jgi:hypothetical protein
MVEGDGHLGPSESCWGDEGVDDVHLLLSDTALPVRFVCLRAPEDHEATISLRVLGVIL